MKLIFLYSVLLFDNLNPKWASKCGDTAITELPLEFIHKFYRKIHNEGKDYCGFIPSFRKRKCSREEWVRSYSLSVEFTLYL